MTDYKINHTGGDYVARVCHKCKKINLGKGYRKYSIPVRRFVLLHEIGHSLGHKSEVGADVYAMKSLIKQGYKKDYYEDLLLSLKLRTKEQIKEINSRL